MSARVDAICAGQRSAIAAALNTLESDRGADHQTARRLVDALVDRARPGGHVVGITGPPGVGKSTLAGRLVSRWRTTGATVGVLAVDPSSVVSGGSLLGDRARMPRDEADSGIFVRSMAAGEQLGGLAAATFDGALVMRAGFDRVLVETVGVGQSEADIRFVADTTVVVVQPASGDTLQFLKAGLMEIPDVFAVNKLDLGSAARVALRELKGALHTLGGPETAVVGVSAVSGEGLDELDAALTAHRDATLAAVGEARRARLHRWIIRQHRDLEGRRSLQALGGVAGALERLEALPAATPPSLLSAELRRD